MSFLDRLGLPTLARVATGAGRPLSYRRPAVRPRLEALEDRRVLSASDLDLSFSGDGWMTDSPRPDATEKANDFARDVTVLADGRILVGGSSYEKTGLRLVAAVFGAYRRGGG